MERDLAEQALRRTLSNQPRPQLPAAGLAAGVLRLIAARQHLEESRRRKGARLLLAAYWMAAILGAAWIVQSLPLPAWSATLWAALAWAGIPFGYAILLWPRRLARWALLFLKPLLAEARGEGS
jgi:hypothetical protein